MTDETNETAEERNEAEEELVRPERRFDLQDAFLLRQEQLRSTLGLGRAVGGHPVAVGDASELNWRGMLASIIPTRYRISKAFAIDADGNRSEQIDLLVFDRHYSPVLIDVGDYLFVPAEAVYAVVEIKQRITLESLRYAMDKVASVRALRRTSAPVRHAGGTFEARNPPPILGGVIALDAGWSDGLGESFQRACQAHADHPGALDLGCALNSGSFELSSESGTTVVYPAETALITFVIRLLHRLQQLASAPAIDYEEYLRALTDPSADA